jgi:hypothetical protein
MHFQVFWEKVCRCHSVGLKFAAVFSLMLHEVVSIGPLHGFCSLYICTVYTFLKRVSVVIFRHVPCHFYWLQKFLV